MTGEYPQAPVPPFIKIPKNLFSLGLSDRKLYVAYLDFKLVNSEGAVRIPAKRAKAVKSFYRYWLWKLVQRGWATETNGTFSLRSYQEVWKSMGVHQTWNKRLKKYRYSYFKVDPTRLGDDRKVYRKKLMNGICGTIAGNKVRQIKWRLHKRQTPGMVKTETFMSSRAIAKLFGLRSSSSGHKLRKEYFNVIPEKPVLLKTNEGYRNRCSRIAL